MTSHTDEVTRRGLLAGAVGLVSGMLAYHAQAAVYQQTDFTQLWYAAVGWRAGIDPYVAVGPRGTLFYWPFPLLYPGTAVLAAVPFSVLSLRAASAAFVGVGAAALALTLSGRRQRHPGRWFVFLSAAWVYVIRTAQWAPLLMAASFSPTAGALLACKPSLGLALFAAHPTVRTAVGGLLFGLVAVALIPTWPRQWLAALPAAYHMSAPITYVSAGGPLILLALLRWKRPEARLLVTLACVPHTTMLYESLPLFLVARRWQEGFALAALSWVCMYRHVLPDYLEMMHTMAWRMTLLLYIPCTLLILTRPNVWSEGNGRPLD